MKEILIVGPNDLAASVQHHVRAVLPGFDVHMQPIEAPFIIDRALEFDLIIVLGEPTSEIHAHLRAHAVRFLGFSDLGINADDFWESLEDALERIFPDATSAASDASGVSGGNPSAGQISVSLLLPDFVDSEFVEDKLVELYQALNEMHVGLGGEGLRVDEGGSRADSVIVDGVPTP